MAAYLWIFLNGSMSRVSVPCRQLWCPLGAALPLGLLRSGPYSCNVPGRVTPLYPQLNPSYATLHALCSRTGITAIYEFLSRVAPEQNTSGAAFLWLSLVATISKPVRCRLVPYLQQLIISPFCVQSEPFPTPLDHPTTSRM